MYAVSASQEGPMVLETDVVIAGAGPTGLMLACELALRDVSVLLLERQLARPDFCRAFNLNARSLELLDRRGLLERFLAEGPTRPITAFGGLPDPLHLSCLDTDRPYTLGIPQTRTEELLEARAAELGGSVRWGQAVTGLQQNQEGVTVQVRTDTGEQSVRARYLAGCDGGRSTVRKLAGIGFPGTPSTHWALLGDVELAEPGTLSFGEHRTERGSLYVIPRPGYVRLITAERETPPDRDAPVTLEQLQRAISHVLDREVPLTRPRWLTRFGDAARQAEWYVQGRVMLAGDAAHIHPPAGAQGLNVGLQDAFNLGWKLAAAVHGWAPPGLLESYHHERHAAGAEVLMNTRAQVALSDPAASAEPLRALFGGLAELEPVRRRLAEIVTGIGTRYAVGAGGHPLLGRLLPNMALETTFGPRTLAGLLTPGRGVLLALAERPDLKLPRRGWGGRLEIVGARAAESRELDAVLVRPDGHVAWLAPRNSDPKPGPLRAALARWFGAPIRADAHHNRT
jgi:2-polyprenyl-6-methoxyphenol hydroxylase-like FAD-dependent oxidoreductase